MRIAILIPDRNDRPELLSNCLRMMEAQTLKPDHIELMNDDSTSRHADITWRYRTGYEHLRGKGFDLIAFIENDDWYSPNYLEEMVKQWEHHGRPELFGTRYTIYYHLKLRKWFRFDHDDRASAMNTLIKPDMEVGKSLTWGHDEDPFTDIHLWHKTKLKKVNFIPKKIIAIGMKHGVGMCGGKSHIDRFKSYVNDDNGFLKDTLDPVSFEFYWDYWNKL